MKVVLLPGLDGTGILFKPFIKALPKNIEVLIISYPTNAKLNYEQLTDLVFQQLPEENFILVGESFSGYIAYKIALRNPKNLHSVIFTATFLESPRPFLLGLFSILPNKLIFSTSIPNFIIKKLLFGLAVNKKLIDLFKQSISQVSPHVLSFRLSEIANLKPPQELCKIKAIYIQASDDVLVPKSCADSFQRVFNNISFFKITGSHFILQVNPLACAKVVVNETAL